MRYSRMMAAALAVMAFIAGCTAPSPERTPARGELLAVEFPAEQALRYRIVTRSDILLDFDPGGRAGGRSARQETSERSEIVLAMRQVAPAERGAAVVEVTCESAGATRSGGSQASPGRDALASLAGKTYEITVSATGEIVEWGQLEEVLKQLGEAAFGGGRYEGRRIKDPDMIAHFIAAQWFMWDAPASVSSPASGVAAGDTWDSPRILFAPMPFVSRMGRTASYTLDSVAEVDGVRTAVIRSEYAAAEEPSMGWPLPYGGAFRMRGTFGFFHGYRLLGLDGRGVQRYDVTNGRLLSDEQSWNAKISAAIPFASLGVEGREPEPNIIIDHAVKIELLP